MFIILLIIYITVVFSLTQMLVFLSSYVRVGHTSFHVGLSGRKVVLCWFGECQRLCTICHSLVVMLFVNSL